MGRGRVKPKAFRPTEEALKRIDKIKELKGFSSDSDAINFLIAGEEAREETSESDHVERGRKIDEARQVNRGDKILLPCPVTERWVDEKLDCEGCHLKCLLHEDQRLFFKGLAYYTQR